MKKLFISSNLIFSALIIISDFLYTTVLYNVYMKGIASILFVLMGVTNLIYSIKSKNENIRFGIMMVIGLTFSMLGDILLEIIFEIGAGLFALGHVFYFMSYCQLLKFYWQDIIIGLTIFITVTLVILFAPVFNFGGAFMQIICIIYALIISMMVSKAITNLIKSHTITNIIIVVGSVLFLFSDLMLLLNQFANMGRIASVLCIASYYPAQIALAYSIFNNTIIKE